MLGQCSPSKRDIDLGVSWDSGGKPACEQLCSSCTKHPPGISASPAINEEFIRRGPLAFKGSLGGSVRWWCPNLSGHLQIVKYCKRYFILRHVKLDCPVDLTLHLQGTKITDIRGIDLGCFYSLSE